ncbi:LysR substrate-binding domain-containing protein [Tolumonas osonensis]|uniref:HTH-type transcriptional regulator MetR n=1 Tax=Tolumonas osonensis TaxID=675874 RepID=A0A841GJA3_9GAMM|nr:LysR substrate-binding domain-containing protein [Tolumonas osonensis]MBB6056766.1 LysR family transcriptional regulator for metE and metH [Tolumonas osonensis]
MFELKHLRSLRALKERGSLAAAADSLYLSQSALSHQLSELEQRLGGPLFLRKSKPIRFTADGLRLVTLADTVLPQVDGVMQYLRREQTTVQLRLHVECYSCIRWLTPALQLLQQRHPELELSFAAQPDFLPQQALLQGDLDMVLTADLLPEEGIYYAPLFDFEMRLVVPVGHRLTGPDVITPDLLGDEVLLSYPVAPQRLDVLRHFMTPAGIKPKQIKNVDNTLMLMQMVAAGWGIAVLPDWVCQEFEPQGLIASKALGDGLWRRLHAAIRIGDRQQPAIRTLVNTLRRRTLIA